MEEKHFWLFVVREIAVGMAQIIWAAIYSLFWIVSWPILMILLKLFVPQYSRQWYWLRDRLYPDAYPMK